MAEWNVFLAETSKWIATQSYNKSVDVNGMVIILVWYGMVFNLLKTHHNYADDM